MIRAGDLPTYDGTTDVLSARKWFGALADQGITFHADDDVTDYVDTSTMETVLDDEAAGIINEVVRRYRKALPTWPDPDFIYDLAGQGRFPVEADYGHTGFVIDMSIPAASRTGYVSLPGRELPTIIVEEGNRFFAVQPLITPEHRRLSEVTAFRVVPSEGITFGGGANHIDVSGAILLEDRAIVVSSIEEIDEALADLLDRATATAHP